MTGELTTLNDVLAALKTQGADLPLVFETDEGDIGGGYHVTELKQAAITSIDCGGNLHDWSETHVQLLDGQTGTHMSAGKFTSIADRSAAKISTLGEAPLFFELGLKNNGLRRYQVQGLVPGDDRIRLQLSEGHAVCKPAAAATARAPKATPAAVSCCGVGMVPSHPSVPSDCCA